ncbi:hypothetical protein OM076_29770 [Solirubrobacter ginsenosidimutans]|uniref:Uncharacterized protein n=1 Tax=Solirubrobacter ginsenosidimutans TaxID=490573 RepID=A0A9X3MWW6_9ACTN|nr:hypothetical protein [Solirubrobacter ginsenosidimutans]MDA0164496.1 hypothetical protein [Solirubrobacter ginsenosidimutans]
MLPRLIAAAIALSLVAAAPAAADSIAYIQNGDVWLATPDGARKQQVTHTGGYYYVSQADDGTMAALVGGEHIQKLSRTGQVLADFPTYVSDGAPAAGGVTQFHGPFDPEISPDGSKIAFEYFNDTYDAEPGCNELTVPPCFAYTQSQGVGITNSTGFTGVDAYGILTGWIAPHWVSNDVLLRSSPGANLNDDAVFTRVGETTNDHWFYDPNQGLGVKDVELSRDLQTVVGIAGFNDEKLRVYRTTMSPFGAPDWDHTPFTNHENVPVAQQCYELPGKFDNTTLAPSSKAMAYSTAEGIFVAAIPDNCAPGDAGALVFPGAKYPDWGPADVPPASAFEATPAPTTETAKPGAARKLALSVSRAGKVKVTVPGAGKVKVTAKRKRRTIASASKTAKAAGTVTFKLKARGRVTVTATFQKLSAHRTVTLRG